jgi:phosphodiesterase/alkaline phosphatase D-like protein
MLYMRWAALAAGAVLACAANAGPLPHGVAAGDVSQTKATLWAKVTNSGPVTFELSRSASFTERVVTQTRIVADPDQPVHQNVTGLADGVRYFYRATDASGNVSQGTFVTPHASGRHGLRFGASGDWRNPQAPFVATSNVAERNLDFFIALGDTAYTDRASPLAGPPASTLQQFRAKHAEQLTPKYGINTMVEIRQSTALFAAIDDHEVRDDFAGGAPIASDPRFAGTGAPGDPINSSTLYRDGLQAFHDYMPIERRFVAGTADPTAEGRPDLYRSQRYGRDAEVIVLDARTFRDTPLPETLTPEQTVVAAQTPGRTMLGRHQMAQLKADLLDAQADGVTWKVIAIPQPIQNLGPVNAYDRFEGYAAERNELLKFIDQNNIKNVMFVAADIHGTVMNNLTYQELVVGSNGKLQLGPRMPVRSFEVTVGPGAYNAPFGPTVIQLARSLGRLSDQEVAFYDNLEIRPDEDALPNDKDDFVRSVLNSLFDEFGYSAFGLEDSEVSYELLSGDWVMAHLFGWTEFEIDAVTQNMLITTWGLAFDEVLTALEAAANGNTGLLASLTPRIFGQLLVRPEDVPEPAAFGLLAIAAGFIVVRRRRSYVV